MAELVKVADVAIQRQQQHTFLELGPAEMVKRASEIATVLKDVIDKQKLFSNIGGKKYVKHEGWSTLGSILGILPREKEVIELKDGSYEAKVELYNFHTSQIVGQASALCGVDEKRWGSADRFARRSMAVTRATGKAYRLGFSWIIALAGYEPTPAEEMPEAEEGVAASVAQKAKVSAPKALPKFDKADESWMNKLALQLEPKGVTSLDAILWIAEKLHGQEIVPGLIDKLIEEQKASEIPF